MPKHRIIITLGVIIALLPLLGFPPSWESFFQVFAGLAIITVSIWNTIDKKLTQKAKAHQREVQKRAEVESATEHIRRAEADELEDSSYNLSL